MRKSQGQATLEYIFVLVVVLTIALGALAQFNTGFRGFIDSYYGQYLQCLLEVGELPAIGYQGQGQCDSEFTPFTFAQGRQPIKPVDVGPTPTVNEITPGGGVNLGANENPGQVDPGQSGRGASGDRNFGSNSVATGKFDSNPFAQNEGRARSVPLNGTDLKQNGGRLGFGDAQIGGGDSNDVAGGRPLQVPIREAEEDNTSVTGRTAQVPATERDLNPSKSRIPADAAQKKAKASEEGWSFPDFLRFLLIAIIIIAMVVFFGGQFLQVSKSREK